jgi:hypothetical protein
MRPRSDRSRLRSIEKYKDVSWPEKMGRSARFLQQFMSSSDFKFSKFFPFDLIQASVIKQI